MISIQGIYSVAQTVRLRAKELSDDIVFHFEDKKMTFAEYHSLSSQTANGLLAEGVQSGDRIAFLGKNSPVYFELIAAAAKIRAVVSPLNWRLAGPELEYVLNDSGAKVIFAAKEFRDVLMEIQSSLTACPKIFLIDGEGEGTPSYTAWQQQFSDSDPNLDVSADDALLQLYTSGTTGRPKGAILTDRMMLALRGQEEGDTLQDWQRYTRGETGLLAMPCFHVGGTSFGLSIIHSGAQVVVLAEYDPSETLKLIESYKIAKIFVVPSTLQMLLKDPQFDKTDFSNLQFIFYGASPIPLELMREATKKIGCGFVQMYGMTETGGTIVALSPEDHLPDSEDETEIQRMRSVGIGMSGVELKIIDQQGRNLPNGEIGEIATRSVKNIKAYWNLPEATKSTIDDDGWLRTGDAGYLDDDGYLYMHDRVKDMIISGGENVYPAEVEDAVYSHPAVEDVAVIGVPDDKWGEAIKAFVVVKDDVEVSADDIIRFARTRIAKFKCPKTIDFIDRLPRNPSGKILRRELREPYWKDKQRAVN